MQDREQDEALAEDQVLERRDVTVIAGAATASGSVMLGSEVEK